MKKILAILLAVLMTVSCMSLTAFAADAPVEPDVPGVVTIGGVKYTETTEVKLTQNTDGEVFADGVEYANWGWKNVVSYTDSPSVHDVVAALQKENAYLKVSGGCIGILILQGPNGNGTIEEWSRDWDSTDKDGYIDLGDVAYYNGEYLLNKLVAAGGTPSDVWNIVFQNPGNTIVTGVEVVTLSEYVEPVDPDAGHWETVTKPLFEGSETFANDGDSHSIEVPTTFAAGETYKLTIKGHADDGFRIWIGGWSAQCVPHVPEAADVTGDFEYTFEITVNEAPSHPDQLKYISFKAYSGGTLKNLSIEYIGLETLVWVEGGEAEPETATGYIINGDGTHAVIINGAVITSAHEYNDDGVCVFCHHVKPVVEEEAPEVAPEETPDVEIEAPVESETEETDEDNVVVDDNPTTGVAFGAIALTLAVCTLIASKRR